MKLYVDKKDTAASGSVVLDDMMLTKDLCTTAGSKMLDGYKSLFAAEAAERLEAAGYAVSGKANVGEFSIDLLGETSYFGASTAADGTLNAASAEILKQDANVKAAIAFDVNGAPRRAAAVSGLVYIKPTYGTVSRYGTIPAACSGETVGVMAKNIDECREILDVIVGHDDKDGTSHSEEKCALLRKGSEYTPIKKIAILKAFSADAEVSAKTDAFKAAAAAAGVEVCEADGSELLPANAAWNVLMCAELCNNVSRYDGVKYGYRSPNYTNIDELYTNSRTEAFGDLLKTAIIYGSDSLSTGNYMKVYDKALRVRRVMCEAFAKLFAEYDAVVIPACSKAAYTEADIANDTHIAFSENLYTAPASITGLPALVAGGVQLIGKAFSENALFELAKMCEKEGSR